MRPNKNFQIVGIILDKFQFLVIPIGFLLCWSFLSLLLFLLLSKHAEARVIHFGNETEVLRIVYGTSTILRFPQDVRTISQVSRFEIQPANETEPDYSVLQVKPRFHSGFSNVNFILSDGSIVRAKLIVGEESSKMSDGLYDFKPKSSLIETAKEEKNPITEIELLKAMVRGDIVANFKVVSLEKEIPSEFQGVKATLVRTYSGNSFNGYVIRIKNNLTNEGIPESIEIDLPKLNLGDPSLSIISQVDEATLKGGQETLLRLITKPSVSYRNLHLPISISQKKENL